MTAILAGVSWCKNCSPVETFFFKHRVMRRGLVKKYIYISCIVPGGSSGFPETTYSCLVSRWHVFLKLGDWGRHNRRPLFKGWPEAPKHQMHVFRMIWYTSFSWITYCPWHAVLQKHHCVPKECAVLKWVQNLLEASAPPLWQLAFFLWQ